MSSSHLAKQLKALAGARLDVLSEADQSRFSTQVERLLEKIQRTERLETITALENDIPFGARSLFTALLKKSGLKKPRKTAAPEEMDRFIKDFKAFSEEFKKQARRLSKVLNELRKSSDDEALISMSNMPAGELDELSRLANLTKPGGNRSTLFRIPKSAKGRRDWLAALRQSEFANWF